MVVSDVVVGRIFLFFFQAEDGIRDTSVTGVQTCALPICHWNPNREVAPRISSPPRFAESPWPLLPVLSERECSTIRENSRFPGAQLRSGPLRRKGCRLPSINSRPARLQEDRLCRCGLEHRGRPRVDLPSSRLSRIYRMNEYYFISDGATKEVRDIGTPAGDPAQHVHLPAELFHGMIVLALVNELLQDLRYGLRTLRQSPGFAIVAVLTLGIGIGANTAIFSFVNGVLLKPLPYGEPERIVRVLEKPPGGGRNGISTLNYLDWEKDNTVFEYLAAQTGGSVTLTGVNEPVQLRGSRVSPHYFDIFGIKTTLGRTFAADEGQLGKERVAVLSHALWDSQFGADPKVIGRTITLDGAPHTIIGVLPAGGAFDRAYAQIWRPLAFEPQNMTRNFHWFGAFAKLKRGVTLKQAVAQMHSVGARIAQASPDANKGWGVSIERFADTVVGTDLRQSLYMLLSAVGMVLLIGCANLANLTPARGTAREREVAIRASIGAGRWRLVRQFLTENVLLSICGGVFGLGLGLALKKGLELAVPPFSLPREANVAMDGRVLLFTLALAVFTGIVFGLAPALQATRPDLAGCMKEGGRGASSGGRHKVRGALVVTEVALAFVLLSGAGLLIRSFFRMQQVDTGFDSTNVLTAGLPTPNKRYPDPAQLTTYLRQVVSKVEAVS